MAVFFIEDIEIYNSFTNITGVSWEVAEDPLFVNMVDSVTNSKDVLNGWFTPLKKIGRKGHYDEFDVLHVRCKVHVDNGITLEESDWFIKDINNNVIRTSKIRYKGKVVSQIDFDNMGNITKQW